ncbi:MAG: tetratricopeptide repeat protein [Verrucomicrobiales bacterium]|nr:tetratricopeptide repeat protein [Verrucomicrobiales bacterium]
MTRRGDFNHRTLVWLGCGLAGALLAHVSCAADAPPAHTNAAPTAAAPKDDAVEREFRELQALDDAAMAEVDRWIRDNRAFAAKGAGVPDAELNRRIQARLEPVRRAYEDFIARHPTHVGARLAFGSFLHDLEEEAAAEAQLKKALELDPKNPAAWNNLANHFAHDGNVKTAFDYYAKAIELKPDEPVYYRNFAGTVYLFRKEAAEHFKLGEQQVFEKALDLYRKAARLAPDDFTLATDLAQTFYALRPPRFEEALRAWTNALTLARDDIEREGVHLHLARWKWLAGRTNEARAHLNLVTNTMYAELKTRLLEKVVETNASPAVLTTNAPALNLNAPAPASPAQAAGPR